VDESWVTPLTHDAGGRWFDGYVGQEGALIDEFDGRFGGWRLAPLLRILDRYDLLVETKGGHTWWAPLAIAITTNFHPLEWFDYTNRQVQYRALCRRITEVFWWKGSEDRCTLLHLNRKTDKDRFKNFFRGPASPPVQRGTFPKGVDWKELKEVNYYDFDI